MHTVGGGEKESRRGIQHAAPATPAIRPARAGHAQVAQIAGGRQPCRFPFRDPGSFGGNKTSEKRKKKRVRARGSTRVREGPQVSTREIQKYLNFDVSRSIDRET
jgi:hypothetical protein